MAWWVWALTLWALLASAAVVFLLFALILRVELLEELSAERDDLWDDGFQAAERPDSGFEASAVNSVSGASRRLLTSLRR